MGKIDLGKMDSAAEELWEEAKRIRHLLVQIEEVSAKAGAETDRGQENPEKSGNALAGGSLPGSGQTEEILMGERLTATGVSGKKDRVKTALTKADTDEICERMQTEAIALEKASAALRRIILLYKEVEGRVIAVYDGEYIVVPRTIFATSHFENLQTYQSIIPVRSGALSKRDIGQSRPGEDGSDIAAASIQTAEKLEGIL